jgi:hypothetical protein
MNQETDNFSSAREQRLHLLALFLFGVLLYAVTLGAGFTNWDDQFLVLQNNVIQSISWATVEAAFSHFFLNHYHPLVILSFAIEFAVGGLNPFFFHLTNITLNGLNGVLVYLICMRLSGNAHVALVSSLLFVVHPVHAEAVAWVSARKDLLSTFFYLLGIVFYLKRGTNRLKTLLLATTAFVFSLLSKASAVSFPAVLIVLDAFNEEKLLRRHFAEKVHLFALSLIFSWIAVKAQYSTGFIPNASQTSIAHALTIPFFDLLFYVLTFLAPFSLSPFYPFPGDIGADYSIFFWLSPALVAVTTILIWKFLRTNRLFILGVVVFLVAIAPTLQLIPVGRTLAADRFLYLPSFGLCFSIGVLIASLMGHASIRTRMLTAGICFTGFALFALLTVRQSSYWQSSFTLWSRVIKQSPTLAEAYSKRGTGLIEIGDLARAQEDFSRAIVLLPSEPEFYYNRALTNHQLHRVDSAIADMDRAIATSPADGILFQTRGKFHFEKKQYRRAIADFNSALWLNPNLVEAHVNRATALVNCHLLDSARADVEWCNAKGIKFDVELLNRVIKD